MRILIVSDTSSHMPGGVPTETRALIQGLGRRGHVIGLFADAPLSGAESAVHYPLAIPVGPSFLAEADRALTDFQPDFVHVMSINSVGLLRLSRILASRRWALTVHSLPPYERKLPGYHGSEPLHYALRSMRFALNTGLWRHALRSTAVPQVVVHSRFVHDIVRRYGHPADRLSTIPLPFESAPPSSAEPATRPDGVRIVTVGGLAHTKGQHDLVKALPRLVEQWPDVSVLLIGEIRDASYLRHLHALAGRLGVERHLQIASNLDNAAKSARLAEATIYVQPSHEEGFCLAYAEAAAVVPRLVGTDTGAIAALSADDPGARVVPARDPAALARAILAVAAAPLPPDHLRTRASRISRAFSLEGYLDAHERLFIGPQSG